MIRIDDDRIPRREALIGVSLILTRPDRGAEAPPEIKGPS
jgi:hypothetical protein